ncbi:MAG: hypothetical protein K2H82_07810, partial [Oscillospiraceae bacterium]|nr:hypothetical protein [Oscillospiraceae bacterium]
MCISDRTVTSLKSKPLKLIIRYKRSEDGYPSGIMLRDIETELTELTDEITEEILPEHAEHYVYHNISYEFYISGAESVPTKLLINDENFPFVVSHEDEHLVLSLNSQNTAINQKPFLDSFGAVRIELVINNKIYATENIYVKIDRHANQNIINMIGYIYQNSEQFLYEEHKYSKIQTGIKKHQTIPIEIKLRQCEEIRNVYEKCYVILRKNPYSKLIQTEKTDHFGRLQSVSPRTMQYIAQHADELEPVAYYTGITVNQQNYQPRRTLIKTTQETKEIYENQVILDFLCTILQSLLRMETDLQQRLHLFRTPEEQGDYVDSRVYIYKHSIRALQRYLEQVQSLIQKFRKLFRHYAQLFPMPARELRYQPKCSPVFCSNMPYRAIYEKISTWFAYGNYHLRQHDLLLSFISISKIYEYYCLVKFLEYFSRHPEFEKTEFSRFLYPETKFYKNTRYNNTFLFRWHEKTVTLYFQPVIYGKSDYRYNQIYLYRNTSSTVAGGRTGRTYTPDFLIKLKSDAGENYFMMDAKY